MTQQQIFIQMRVEYHRQIGLPEETRNWEDYRRMRKELRDTYNKDITWDTPGGKPNESANDRSGDNENTVLQER